MKKWLRLTLQLLSLLLFVFIIWWAGPETWRVVWEGDRRLLLGAIGVYGVAGLASTVRLQLMTRAVTGQATISWRRMFYVNWVARALGLVLPRTVSTVGGKAVALKALGVPLRQSVWIVFVDNVYDLLLLGLWLWPGFMWLQGRESAAAFWLTILILTLISGGLVFWGAQPGRLEPLLRRLQQIPWLAKRLNLDDKVLIPAPGYALAAFGVTILLHATLIASFFLIGEAINSPASLILVTSSYPFVQLSLIIALAPAGLGLFDLGWLGLLRLGGLSENEALAFVVAQRAYIYLFVLAWAVVSLLVSWTERTEPVPVGSE